MPTLSAILLATVAGGVLSVVAAAAVALNARAAHIPHLISFAVGALLGAAFLEIVPHAFVSTDNIPGTALTILLGLLGFFVLEKLVLWRHCHEELCEAHDPHAAPAVPATAPVHALDHDHGRSGLMIMIGDTFHNFVDGILIAAAFLADFQVGVVTAVAIIAHEVPSEVSDFVILLHSGYSRRQAFWVNLLSSAAMVVGGLIGYLALSVMVQWIPTMLAIAAASMLYVAVADLIPGLHKRTELRHTAQQIGLIAAGVAVIALTSFLTHG
ncbi:MAG: ZIP family metal transporter [Burkholderiales bacterium]